MPPRVHFIVYDQAAHVVQRKSLGFTFRLQAKGFVQRKQSCFDFHTYTAAVNPVTVADAAAVAAGTTAPAAVEAAIDTLLTPPYGAADAVYALRPKAAANWMPMRVGTYTPDLHRSAEEMTFVAQVHQMTAVFNEAIAANCRIFVGPEAVLYNGVGSGNKKIPFSSDERDEIMGILSQLTAGRDLMLFIPGTLWWIDAGGMVHNSLIAFSEGEALAIDYDKKEWTGDERAEAVLVKGSPSIGGTPYCYFTWKGQEIGVQICQDSATGLARAVDVHVILGWGTGLFAFKHRPGGVGIYADAQGMGRVDDEFTSTAIARNVPGTITVTNAHFARTPV